MAKFRSVLLVDDSNADNLLHSRMIREADFADEIVQPVLEHVDTVAATSGLVGPAGPSARPGSAGNRFARRGSDRPNRAASKDSSRIGEHVRRTMAELAASGRLTARIVGDLLDPRYCKTKFSLGYPFLKPVDQSVPLSRQGNDRHGRRRYWKKPLTVGHHEFLVCNNWFVWQRDAFDAWVRDVA